MRSRIRPRTFATTFCVTQISGTERNVPMISILGFYDGHGTVKETLGELGFFPNAALHLKQKQN